MRLFSDKFFLDIEGQFLYSHEGESVLLGKNCLGRRGQKKPSDKLFVFDLFTWFYETVGVTLLIRVKLYRFLKHLKRLWRLRLLCYQCYWMLFLILK